MSTERILRVLNSEATDFRTHSCWVKAWKITHWHIENTVWLDCVMDTSGHLVTMMSNEAEKLKLQQHASTERSVTLGKDWKASHKPGLLEQRRVRSVREANCIPGTTTQLGQNGLVHYCQFLLTPRWVGGGDCGQRRIPDLLLYTPFREEWTMQWQSCCVSWHVQRTLEVLEA